MKKQIKTRLTATLHDFAVIDAPKKAYMTRNNWRTQLESANSVESSVNYVGVHSSLSSLYSGIRDFQMRNFDVKCLFAAFSAKYANIYEYINDYMGTQYDLEDDFSQFLSISEYGKINPDDTSAQNIAKCLSNWVEWCYKNDVNNFIPISLLRDRAKVIKKNQEKRAKKTIKNESKNAAKYVRTRTKEDWLKEQINIMLQNGIDENTAKMCAEMMYQNMQKK